MALIRRERGGGGGPESETAPACPPPPDLSWERLEASGGSSPLGLSAAAAPVSPGDGVLAVFQFRFGGRGKRPCRRLVREHDQ